ncbi:FUSC family protein [Streptomyces sp. NPDC047022]|uniref:FUSC family protein n=1 Tax=Streptomyces sp. NPDC047022 TaxID=3155737 RepID=UPI0033F82EC8
MENERSLTHLGGPVNRNPLTAARGIWRGTLRRNTGALRLAGGLRAAVVVVLPVVVGTVRDQPVEGMLGCLGALNVTLADIFGDRRSRMATLGLVAVANTLSIGAGLLASLTGLWAVPLMFCWVFVVIGLGVLGPTADRVTWFAVVMFSIGLGVSASSVPQAAWSTLMVLLGGLWALAALTLVPGRQERLVLRALGQCFASVGHFSRMSGGAVPSSAEALDRETIRMHDWLDEARTVCGRREVGGRLRALLHSADLASACVDVLHENGQASRGREKTSDRTSRTSERLTHLGSGFLLLGGQLARGRSPAPLVLEPERVAARPPCGVLPDTGTRTLAVGRLQEALDHAAGGTGAAEPTAVAHAAKGAEPAAWDLLRGNMTPSSIRFRYALRFATAATSGLALAYLLGLEKGYWVVITVAVVVKPELSLSLVATEQRVLGTVLGALLGVSVIILCPTSWALIIALFVATALAVATVRVNYGLSVVFVTPLVLILLNVPHPGDWRLADIRVLDTLLGVGIGLLVSVTVLRASEHGVLRDHAARAMDAAADYLHAAAFSPRHVRSQARRTASRTAREYAAAVERAVAETHTESVRCTSPALRLSAALDRLWKHTAALSLIVGDAPLPSRNAAEATRLELRVRKARGLLAEPTADDALRPLPKATATGLFREEAARLRLLVDELVSSAASFGLCSSSSGASHAAGRSDGTATR